MHNILYLNVRLLCLPGLSKSWFQDENLVSEVVLAYKFLTPQTIRSYLSTMYSKKICLVSYERKSNFWHSSPGNHGVHNIKICKWRRSYNTRNNKTNGSGLQNAYALRILQTLVSFFTKKLPGFASTLELANLSPTVLSKIAENLLSNGVRRHRNFYCFKHRPVFTSSLRRGGCAIPQRI